MAAAGIAPMIVAADLPDTTRGRQQLFRGFPCWLLLCSHDDAAAKSVRMLVRAESAREVARDECGVQAFAWEEDLRSGGSIARKNKRLPLDGRYVAWWLSAGYQVLDNDGCYPELQNEDMVGGRVYGLLTRMEPRKIGEKFMRLDASGKSIAQRVGTTERNRVSIMMVPSKVCDVLEEGPAPLIVPATQMGDEDGRRRGRAFIPFTKLPEEEAAQASADGPGPDRLFGLDEVWSSALPGNPDNPRNDTEFSGEDGDQMPSGSSALPGNSDNRRYETEFPSDGGDRMQVVGPAASAPAHADAGGAHAVAAAAPRRRLLLRSDLRKRSLAQYLEHTRGPGGRSKGRELWTPRFKIECVKLSWMLSSHRDMAEVFTGVAAALFPDQDISNVEIPNKDTVCQWALRLDMLQSLIQRKYFEDFEPMDTPPLKRRKIFLCPDSSPQGGFDYLCTTMETMTRPLPLKIPRCPNTEAVIAFGGFPGIVGTCPYQRWDGVSHQSLPSSATSFTGACWRPDPSSSTLGASRARDFFRIKEVNAASGRRHSKLEKM